MMYRISDRCIGRLVVETYHVIAGSHIIYCLKTLAIVFANDDGCIDFLFGCFGIDIVIVVGSKDHNSIVNLVFNILSPTNSSNINFKFNLKSSYPFLTKFIFMLEELT